MIGTTVIRDMCQFLHVAGLDSEGQDVAEYAIMLAVVLVIVLGMVNMMGANTTTLLSSGQ